jgi:L-gulonate 5-dehydrogenase
LKLVGVQEPGGFQQELLVEERLLHDVGDLPPDLAAFVEPLTIALQAVKRGGVKEGEHVYVVGAGPIGQALILASRWLGARVAISDLVKHRLKTAREVGAELTLDAKLDVAGQISDWTDGWGPPVVIDATGVAAVVRSAVDLVAAAGRIVTVGISTTDVPLPIAALIRKELSIIASRNSVQMFPEAIKVVHKYRREVAAIISHHISLAQVEDTIKLVLQHPDAVEKAIVVFDDGKRN